MKKFVCVILCLVMLMSAVTVASAAPNGIKITVANDLHLDLEDSFADSVKKRNSASTEYAHVSAGGIAGIRFAFHRCSILLSLICFYYSTV